MRDAVALQRWIAYFKTLTADVSDSGVTIPAEKFNRTKNALKYLEWSLYILWLVLLPLIIAIVIFIRFQWFILQKNTANQRRLLVWALNILILKSSAMYISIAVLYFLTEIPGFFKSS